MYLHEALGKNIQQLISSLDFLSEGFFERKNSWLSIMLMAKIEHPKLRGVQSLVSKLYLPPLKKKYKKKYLGEEIEISYQSDAIYRVSYKGNTILLDVNLVHNFDYLIQMLMSIDSVDTMMLKVMRRNGLETICDIGSNVGFFSFSATILGFDVKFYAEPLGYLSTINLENGVENSELIMSRDDSPKSLFISKVHTQGSSYINETVDMFPSVFGYPLDKLTIKSCRLDEVIEEGFDVLKIDVEGAELDVLLGADKLLTKNLIKTIYFECYTNKLKAIDSLIQPYFLKKYVLVNGKSGDISYVEFKSLSDLNYLSLTSPPMFLYSQLDIR